MSSSAHLVFLYQRDTSQMVTVNVCNDDLLHKTAGYCLQVIIEDIEKYIGDIAQQIRLMCVLSFMYMK